MLSPGGHANSYGLVSPFLNEVIRRRMKVVLMTASGVEHDDNIPLRKIELDVIRSGVPHVILRPSWFMQNFNSYWYAGIQHQGLIALPAADSKTTFIDARDIGAAAAVALESNLYDGQAVALTGPQALTYTEAASVLSKAGGRQIRYAAIDDGAFRTALASSGLPPDYADLLIALFGFVRMGAASEVTPALAKLLGRAPRTLADYAQDHARFFRADS